MSIRVVTDSTADLPPDIVDALDITVVPLHIYFGEEQFQDGITISKDEFYRRLVSPVQPFPRTSAPSTGAFEAVYRRLGDEADGIVSIHLSPKLSATHSAAVAASHTIQPNRRVEVVDSASASLGLGLLVVQAAQLARDGLTLDAIVQATLSAVPRTRFFGVLETLEYLRQGGRIGRAAALLGSLLHTRPLVGLRDGVAYPIERVRGRQRSLDRIIDLAKSCGKLARLAVGHTTDVEGMQALASRLTGCVPPEMLLRTQCGATLGSYLGPGAYGVALIEEGS